VSFVEVDRHVFDPVRAIKDAGEAIGDADEAVGEAGEFAGGPTRKTLEALVRARGRSRSAPHGGSLHGCAQGEWAREAAADLSQQGFAVSSYGSSPDPASFG
jgi:hypothetical protein